MVSLRVLCAALLWLSAVWGTSSVRADEAPVILRSSVWEGFQEYAALKNPSAFAVSRDGSMYGYSYCPERRCVFNTAKKVALDSCVENGGEDCIIFAVKQDIQVAYQVLDLTATGSCPTMPTPEALPEIVVVADVDKVVYDHGLGIAAITELDKRGKARVNPVDFELLGMTLHEFFDGGNRSGTEVIDGENGAHCAGMTDGTVHLRMASTIYVASEFPAVSCLYGEVLAHEEKHQTVGTRLFRQLATNATRLLRADLHERPYIAVADPGLAELVAQARIDAAIEAAAEEFWQRYDEAQSQIDTDAEYLRVATACADAREYLR